MEGTKTYVKVIVPLRFRETVTYSVPEEMEEKAAVGNRVDVLLANKPYKAIVQEVTDNPGFDASKIKNIVGIDDTPAITNSEISLWKTMASYYMCSTGEVLKAAVPILMESPKQKRAKQPDTTKKRQKAAVPENPVSEEASLPYLGMKILTPVQQEAFDKIKINHKKGQTVLLDGLSSSGKTEIYIHAAKECLEDGKNALILVPDVISGMHLLERFNEVFGDRTILYHNQLTLPKKKLAIKKTHSTSCKHPAVVISTRAGIFLPLGSLGLVVVDDEHDTAYKQFDPAPRFNGRDAALILAKAKGANVILGSSTPSFESLYNAACGKYAEVTLNHQHPVCREAAIEIIDMKREKRKRAVTGSYTMMAAKEIAEAAARGEEIAIFKPRRAFAQDDALAAEIISTFKDSGIGLYSDIKEIEAKENKPAMIVVLQGEALLNAQDFRADEKALQLLSKLKGILEKGEVNGKLIIQTTQPEHNVFKALANPLAITNLLKEREEYGFPPYKRMVQLYIKDTYEDRLKKKAERLEKIIREAGIEDLSLPTPPPYEKIPGEHTLIISIRLKRDRSQETQKRNLLSEIEKAKDLSVIIDVDPL